MRLSELHISNFRNLRRCVLSDLSTFNFIHGVNGSGKTSVLEAIHMLSLTRSARSRKINSVVNFDSRSLLVRGELVDGAFDDSRMLGIQRGRDKSLLVKYAGERLRSFSDLAGLLPVQLINPDSFQLFEGSPTVRRQFLDWSVFHVKHLGFYEEWSRYRKAVKQRNTLLRRGKLSDAMLSPWEEEIALTGAKITAMRRAQFAELEEAFVSLLNELQGGSGQDASHLLDASRFTMRFISGWDDDEGRLGAEDLRRLLNESREQDLRQGFTRVGPHRADIRFSYGGTNAAEVLSRGQIKTLVCALKLAQCRLMRRQNLDVLLLVDDLPAELDRERRAALFGVIASMDMQVFATSIEASDLDDAWLGDAKEIRRFHVEHFTNA